VRDVFERALATEEVGAAVAIVVDDVLVVDLWGGYQDRARRNRWIEDALCCAFSSTKGVTATCALLAAAAELDLDARVVDYWPEFALEDKGAIRVYQLLDHSAGLVGFHEPFPREQFYDWTAVTARLAAERAWWTPGSAHGYHARSFGFLIGEVVRRATGRTVSDWLASLGIDLHIGLDSQLQRRCVDIVPARIRAGATLDVPAERRPFMRAMNDLSTPTGAAFQNPSLGASYMNTAAFRAAELPAMNGHGTARAFATLYGRLAGAHSPVPSELLGRATRPASTGFDRVLLADTTFGLGFQLGIAGSSSFGHSGAGGCFAFADPERRLGFAYLMNQLRPGVIEMNDVARRLVDAVYAALA
jgi:CubicO group peptidase (beta-lactamase class C family)